MPKTKKQKSGKRGLTSKPSHDMLLLTIRKQPKQGEKMVDSLKNTLMVKDGLTGEEADEQIKDARARLMERLGNGELPMDFCEEEFGLEPDYLEELLF